MEERFEVLDGRVAWRVDGIEVEAGDDAIALLAEYADEVVLPPD